MVEGQNQQAREETAAEFQGGDVLLLSSTNAIADSDTTATANETATTVDGDWSITSDNANGTTTLENSSVIDFGQTSDFVIDQILVEDSAATGNYLIEDNPTGDTDLSGDGEFTIEVGNLTYTLGGE